MSENDPDRVSGADDRDQLSRWSGEDLDALLAQAESLAEEVEEQLGGVPTAGGENRELPLDRPLDESGLARDVEEKLAQIESLMDTSVAEVGSAPDVAPAGPASPLAATSARPAEAGAAGAVPPQEADRALVTEADHEVAEEEIGAALHESRDGAAETPPSSTPPAPEPPSPRRPGVWGALRSRALRGMAWALELADWPFAAWPPERKNLIGSIGLATLVMACVAWTLALLVND